MSALTLAGNQGIGSGYEEEVIPALRPSEYTAALIQVLRRRPLWICGRDALEVGPGSGAVLAMMGELGAASLCGVDIEPAAVATSSRLLRDLGYGDKLELVQGDMWWPLSGRRFDVIAANLPQFPMKAVPYAGRLRSWSSGGPDGRCVLDRFIKTLAEHLAPGGRALITHNGFIDLEKTRAMLAPDGLSLRVSLTVLVSLNDEKLALMTSDILRAEQGRSIHRCGPYAFGEMHVVEIGAAAALG